MQAVCVTVPFYSVERRMPRQYVAFIHVGSILVADAVLAVAAVWLLHRRCTFLKRIQLPKEREVLRWYCRQISTPAPPIWLK